MEDIYFSETNAYLPKSGAAVYMGNGTKSTARANDSSNKPAVAATSPTVLDLTNGQEIASWGDNNQFPQDIIAIGEKNTAIPALIDWKARAAYGALKLPYQRVYNEQAKAWDEVPITDSDIVSFFLNENIKRYYREAYIDFYWFWNVFPDLIKNEEGDKIAYIGTHDASWCRWLKMNNKGVIEKMALSSTWGEGIYDPKSLTGMLLDVVNPYDWNLVENIMSNKNLKRFVYPTSYPSPGKAYYQLAPWDGYRTSGWLKVGENIPVFKVAEMDHKQRINIIFRIPTNYWPTAYPDWNNLTPAEQIERKKAKLIELDNNLSGAANAGKAIINEVGIDVDGTKLEGWDIEVLNDKLKDGAGIIDSQEAFAHLLAAMSLDGTLVGAAPGRTLNAGGGSDKLIAFNMYVALLGAHRDVVDEPIYFACRYNGYYEKYPTFFIKTIEAAPQALDTSRKVSQNVQEQWPAKG